MSDHPKLADVARRQAELYTLLGSGSVFGDIGERVAAKVTSSVRISGTGNDLKRPAPDGWQRPTPLAVIGDKSGAAQVPIERALNTATEVTKSRYDRWVARGDRQLGEVKARQLDRRYEAETQLLDTRSSQPATSPFLPLVDFYVFIIFGFDGTILKCLEIARPDLLDYVASEVGRGGRWNYKVSVGLWTSIGMDRTAEAANALKSLDAVPESKGKDD